MLNLALTAIQDDLEDLEMFGTPVIEKYGGLVFPISIQEEIGRTDGGQPILKELVFPVACGVTFEQCVGQRKYQELTPNSRYRSIAYWEQLGDAVINTGERQFAPKSSMVVYDIPARLVVWLNVAKMNVNGGAANQCSIAAPVSVAIENLLHNGRQAFTLDDPAYEKASVEFLFQGQERKDINQIFGRYTYGRETAKFMMWPYDFFALRYTVRLRINRHCLESFTIGTELECPATGEAETPKKIFGISVTQVFGNSVTEVHGY